MNWLFCRSLFVLFSFSFDHCLICLSSLYRFWLSLWYLQIFRTNTNWSIICFNFLPEQVWFLSGWCYTISIYQITMVFSASYRFCVCFITDKTFTRLDYEWHDWFSDSTMCNMTGFYFMFICVSTADSNPGREKQNII